MVSLLINLTWLAPNELLASSFYLLRWIAYAALFPIVMSFDEKFKKKLMVFLFIDGLVILLAGFLQYFFFNSLKSLYYLGWDEHMHRVFSTFFDPNFAGAFFVLFFLFVGGVFVSRIPLSKEKPHPSPSTPVKQAASLRPALKGEGVIFNKYFLFFVLGLTLIAIFLTFSRAALLGLIAGSVVFLFLIKKKKLLFVLLAVMAVFVAIASPQFYDENMNLFRTASSNARLANYATALKFIHDRPLLGVGFNSYRYAKESYGYKTNWTLAPSHADAGVDNSFLFVLATTGIIGFIAYCGLLITILKRAYYLYRKKNNILSVVVISSIAALCVNALFINSLFFPPLMLWMWVLVGLTEA